MFRLVTRLGILAALVAGVWALCNHQRINSWDDAVQLARRQFTQLASTALDGTFSAQADSIRIASFNVRALGADKAANTASMDLLAQIIRQYDLVALQELRSVDATNLKWLMERVNADGGHYTIVISDLLGRSSYREKYAFVFNQQAVQLDDMHTYVVGDPDDVLHREPLVGWFRAAHASTDTAFTFTLVNVHFDSRNPTDEVAYLAQLHRAIRSDGRGEDDVIIAGDFNVGDQLLSTLQQQSGLVCLVKDTATNVRLTRQYDNILVDPLAAAEFTGACGAFDFLKAFNLTLPEALLVSDHLPVWAEFSIYEGGLGDRIAQSREWAPTAIGSPAH